MKTPAEVEFESGRRMMDHRRWSDAVDHLNRAIDLDPRSAQYYGWLAIAYARQGKQDEALKYADRALSLDAKCGAAFEARSRVLQRQEKKEIALVEANRGIQAQPTYLPLYAWAAWLCGKLVPGSAMEYAEKARAIAPQSFEAAFAEAAAKEELGDLEGALSAYGRACAINPEHAGCLLNRGILREQVGDLQGAIQDLTQALQLNSEDDYALERRGAAKHDLGNLEDAIRDYSRAIEVNPEYQIAYANRGSARSTLKDYKGALADLSRALEIDPNDSWALEKRGDVRTALGDAKGALQDYDQAIEANPDNKSAYGSRAQVKRSLQDFAGAIADLTRAIEIDPDYAWAFNERGSVKFYDLKDSQGAIEDFGQAVRADPQYKWAYANRGNARFAQEDYQGALADLNRALQIDPEYTWALQRRAWCHDEVNDHESALADRARLYAIEPKAQLTFDDADSQFWYDQAYQHFTRVLADQIKGHGEHLVEYWECYLMWGQRTTQTYNKGTTNYVHDARSGAGYVCITDKAVRIVSLGQVTQRFVKKKGVAGRVFLAALGSYDMSHRELNDKVWLISHGDIVGVSSDEDVILNTVSGNWRLFPFWGVDKPALVVALNMARSGRLADIWRATEPEPVQADPGNARRDEILDTIRQLAELRDLGAISNQEYETKKNELLRRL